MFFSYSIYIHFDYLLLGNTCNQTNTSTLFHNQFYTILLFPLCDSDLSIETSQRFHSLIFSIQVHHVLPETDSIYGSERYNPHLPDDSNPIAYGYVRPDKQDYFYPVQTGQTP